MARVLMAYYTHHGSTAEIAQSMGRVLTEGGHTPTVVSVLEQPDVSAYDVVVLGSPVHSGVWARPMVSYLRRRREVLEQRPVYGWYTCVRVLEPGGRDHARRHYVPPELTRLASLRDVTAFAGCLRVSEINWDERWTLYLRYDGRHHLEQMSGDFRDWSAIEGWARRVSRDLTNLT